MIGAGVYSVWAPAARSAGQFLLLGLVAAGFVALLNALSSARLAVEYPESGGAYVYGRIRLGESWGFLAGWGFVIGKTASVAAMAWTFGTYVVPGHPKIAAVVAIAVVTTINIGGLHRTVALTRVLLAISASVMVLVIVSAWTNAQFSPGAAWPWFGTGDSRSVTNQLYDTAQSAGLLFFAFAGYARIATLAEEVRDPRRTIPRAIVTSLVTVLLVYGLVGFALVSVVSPLTVGAISDPLRLVVDSGPADFLVPLVRFGAAIATLGALLNLLPGVSRTVLAMARHNDLPTYLAVIDARRSIPARAEITVALFAIVVVTAFELRSALALSGVGVLVYYAVTNASAITLPSAIRWKIAAAVGLVSCLALALCLPPRILITGCGTLLAGILWRWILQQVNTSRRT